jgi:hypothetical protein
METPGFGWRVSLSIIVVFGWFIFLILWLLFYAEVFNLYQNIAVILASILVGIAILAASWASWGIKYGWKYKNEWRERGNKYANFREYDMKNRAWRHGGGSAIYGLGFLGALIYYLTTAPTFWDAVIGFFKAIVWPAFLVYGALKSLGL